MTNTAPCADYPVHQTVRAGEWREWPEGSATAKRLSWAPEVDLLWPTTVDELLLGAAIREPSAARESFAAWKLATGYRQYSDIDFESSRLLPLVWHNLGREACDDPWAAQMSGLRRYHWVHNLARQRELWQLIARMNSIGVTPTLLKGQALLWGGYYAEAGLRPMLDADLLVAAEEAAAVSALLTEEGWRRPHARQGRGFPLAHAENWRQGPRRELDLHAKLLPYPYPAIGAKTISRNGQRFSHGGATFLIPDATDLLWHACVHGRIYAGGDPRRSLLWLADVQRLLTRGQATINWQRLFDAALETRTLLPLREALGYAWARLDAPVPGDWLSRLLSTPLSRAQVRPFFRRVGPRNRYPTLVELWENAWDDYVCWAGSRGDELDPRRFVAYAGRGLLTGLRSGAAVKYGARIAWMTLRQGRRALASPNLVQSAERRLASVASR